MKWSHLRSGASAGDALVDLAANAGARQPAAGAEAAVVAEGAAAGGDGAVDVGAGEAGVDADLLHADAEPLAQVKIRGEIGQTAPRARLAASRWPVRGLVDAMRVAT